MPPALRAKPLRRKAQAARNCGGVATEDLKSGVATACFSEALEKASSLLPQ